MKNNVLYMTIHISIFLDNFLFCIESYIYLFKIILLRYLASLCVLLFFHLAIAIKE